MLPTADEAIYELKRRRTESRPLGEAFGKCGNRGKEDC